MLERSGSRATRTHRSVRFVEGHTPTARLIKKLKRIAANPATAPTLGIFILLVASLTFIVGSVRWQPVLAPERIMDRTHLVRVEFNIRDEEQTRSRRDIARARAPRVFNADKAIFDRLENALKQLLTVLATTESLDDVTEEIQRSFALTRDQFATMRATALDQRASALWGASIERLMGELRQIPLLSNEEFQDTIQSDAAVLELRRWDNSAELISKLAAVNIETDDPSARGKLITDLTRLAAACGLQGQQGAVAVQRILGDAKRTYIFDRKATEQRQHQEVEKVTDVQATYRVGDVLYRRGRPLTEKERSLALVESHEFRSSLGSRESAQRWAGVAGAVTLLCGALAGYVGMFFPRLSRSPWRLASLALLMIVSVGAASWGTMLNPGEVWLTALCPTVFAAMILVVAFDRRLALGVAAAQSLLIATALDLSAGYLLVSMLSAGLVSWQLSDIRTRTDLIRATVLLTVGLCGCVLLVSLIERPLVRGIEKEIFADAWKAALAGFSAGALTLLVLPGVERAFDVVTGMKLSELRDPKQPLLRLLQQRAPGTYNHSLTVASIAEAAAESIGANGLHLYVGALYHDVGKMNKPDYFVENQSGGISRHSKLSPAMSLLVIVGHVKDGVELARQYKLPHGLHHYIESHHGTTLVEYFYDAAKRAADAGDQTEHPDEVEYRYPGPKPQTKEAAILMLSDAVESATRALAEPTPSRIASLVHALATKRLNDGQFDECSLTLRELSTIEEAITRTLCSIYHGRIAYPTAATDSAKRVEQTA